MPNIMKQQTELQNLALEINAEHAKCGESLKEGLAHALRAGDLLIKAKGLCHHGEWEKWVAEHCTFSKRMAESYMQLARNLPLLESKAQRVADLTLREAIELLDTSRGKYQIYPPLDAATEAALRSSIDRFGVLVPVARDQHGNILDGYQRDRIARELGVEYSEMIIDVASEEEAREIARTMNEDRRTMPKEQRLEVEKALREEGHSLRAIAGVVGVSQEQVRDDLSTVNHLTVPKHILGLDGKSRKAPRFPAGEAIRQAKEIKRERRMERDRKRQEMRTEILAKTHPLTGEKWRLFLADIKEAKYIVKESVNAIITDPPYASEYLQCYGYLDSLAYEVLSDGDSLLVLCGQAHLDRILGWGTELWTEDDKATIAEDLDCRPVPSMNYQWTVACLTPGESTQVFGRKIKSNWKPLLWWVKGEYAGEHLMDVITSKNRALRLQPHEHSQSVEMMMEIIERFTVVGDLIYDPFCGGGSTGVAALQTGRLFLGSDVSEEAIKLTADRLAEVCK